MLPKQVIHRSLQLIGLDVLRHRPGGWPWSHTVFDYYPVNPDPRWGHGKPLHPQIDQILASQRNQFASLLDQMAATEVILKEMPRQTNEPTMPYWDNGFFLYCHNGFFEGLDAAVLVGMLLLKRPKRYIEIGSGSSTKFARLTINTANLDTQIISIDPYPRAEIDQLCSTLIRQPLENCCQEVLDIVRPGDILFFDGSHRVFTNSDVTVFFLELLPKVPAGVIIHLHDIFLPADYPPIWNKRLYSEQYILGALLLTKSPPFRILLPNYYACIEPTLSARATKLVQSKLGAVDGSSFWIESVP